MSQGARARVGHLGPAGTFTEEALLTSAVKGAVEPVALETIHDTVMALAHGQVDWAVVPIENSLDGSVTVTLDLLADHAQQLEVVAEKLLAVRHFLAAAVEMPLEQIKTVLTHPQVPGQCRRFLHEQLPGARVISSSSTAEAVRLAADAQADQAVAAIGPRLAAEIYGAVVLREDVQDRDDNLTRFVWLAPRHPGRGQPPVIPGLGSRKKTSIVFWGPGADRAGWLVLCLDQFAHRGINLTKIESRPRRERMGHYMFFVDLVGDGQEPDVAEAIAGLRQLCEQVCVLGSYPAVEGD